MASAFLIRDAVPSSTQLRDLLSQAPPMPYAVLILGATGLLGPKICKELALQKQHFSRIAYLTSVAEADHGRAAESPGNTLEQVVGRPSDPESYRGIDIVVSAVEGDACAKQTDFIDAAFAGGVKHFYPAEYGPDFEHPSLRDEPSCSDKLAVRAHLQTRVQKDPSLGYTYVMTGILSDLLLDSNMLGLSEDKTSAKYLGSPDARVSTTHSDDGKSVARLIVTTLLPTHLDALNVKRHIRFAGSTLATSSLFDAIAYVLNHPVSVTYETEPEDADAGEISTSSRAGAPSVGFGAWDLTATRDQPGQEQGNMGMDVEIRHLGRDLERELKPKGWAEVVWDNFARKV